MMKPTNLKTTVLTECILTTLVKQVISRGNYQLAFVGKKDT